MADRLIPTSATPGVVTGDDFMDAAQEEITKLYDLSRIKLANIGGTADAITADADPPLTGALVDGMAFVLIPTDNNTSSTLTLEIDGGGAVDIVNRDGDALAAGELKADRAHDLMYDADIPAFRIMGHLPAASDTQLPDYRNILYGNGGLEIWQRGAGDSASIARTASTTGYTADRWYLTTGANQASVVSAQSGLADRSRKAGRVQRNSGQTGTGSMIFAYPLTSEECQRLRGETVSLQFLTRAGANWSPTSGTLTFNLYFGTGAEGKRGAGFTGETNPLTGSVNLTAGGSAQEVTAQSSTTVATNVTQGELRFTWTPVGTASTNDWFELDNVQLEAAATETPFEYLPFGVMLFDCRRHFIKSFTYATAPAQNVGFVGALGGVIGLSIGTMWQFPNFMRTVPTIVTYNPSAANTSWRVSDGANDAAVSVDPASAKSGDGVFIVSTNVANGVYAHIHASADAGI